MDNPAQPTTEWRETSVQVLFELTDEEMAYIELKVQLARQVRRLREQQNLTQTALAEKLGSSQSRVAKMEKGDESVSLDLLVRSLIALGVGREDIGRFLLAEGVA